MTMNNPGETEVLQRVQLVKGQDIEFMHVETGDGGEINEQLFNEDVED